MSDQFNSETSLFSDSEPEAKGKLKTFRLSGSSSGGRSDEDPAQRKRSSLHIPKNFRIGTMVNPSGSGQEEGSQQKPEGRGKGGRSVLGLGASVPGQPELTREIVKKDGSKVSVDFWLTITPMKVKDIENIYAIARLSPSYDLTSFIEAIQYQGFNRDLYITAALEKLSPSQFIRFALLGAIRGSNFTKIVDTCETFPQDLVNAFASAGFVKKPKKSRDLTILRCTSAIPNWCAYWIWKSGSVKKLPSEACPAALQFPGAASLPMSKSVRIQHIGFCKSFSKLLPSGSFSTSIYQTAFTNQVAFEFIPDEIKPVLGVASLAESLAMTQDDLQAALA
jgi:hypothetical protein